jgi:hypothetical protein
MNENRFEDITSKDWGDAWDSLPEAPDLLPRRKESQITLRISTSLFLRIKRVAKNQAIPYHVLIRSWLTDAIRQGAISNVQNPEPGPYLEQLNVKMDQSTLDRLKKLSGDLRIPYHRLAREWIEGQVAMAESRLELAPLPSTEPGIRELLVLLLHARNRQGSMAVHGMTRLQKLLFVVEQQIPTNGSFYAYNYGPFSDEVNDAAQALEFAGFIEGTSRSSGPPTFQEMIETVSGRMGPSKTEGGEVVEFELSSEGHSAAERLRNSDPAYERLFQMIETVKLEWDTPKLSDLIDRVYETWPKYAENSVIREEVAQRNRRRSSS